MIEIDKNDFLYKYLSKLGAENLDEKYLEFASNGVSTKRDFERYLYSHYGESAIDQIDEEALIEVLPYFKDLKSLKPLPKKSYKEKLINYKATRNKNDLQILINSKLKDMIFLASMYKLKFKEEDLSDLIQVCNLGLMKAIEKFDVNSHLTIDEYIEFWVSEEIRKTYTKEKFDGKN